MKTHSTAALIYGPELHHLDHLAPLCSLLQIPLITTEEKIAYLARQYYPKLEVILLDYLSVAPYLVNHFDILFYSIPRDLFDEIFFFAQKQARKKIHTIWCPHGNSDKGSSTFFMEALRKEEAALVYGKQMIEFLKEKNAFNQLKGHVVTGNYRLQYYLEKKNHFDPIVEREIQSKLNPNNKTILYAPTWNDYENSSSFDAAINLVAKQLPSHFNLIVKLHPNLILQDEFKIEEILERYSSVQNLLFLTDFPLIYPLLNQIDLYLGDMSSVGYDYLSFDRPMFFLHPPHREKTVKTPYLFRCGIEIKPEQFSEIYTIIDHFFQFELRNYSEIRKEIYTYTFGKEKGLSALKQEIEHLYSLFPDPELNFF